MNTWKSLDNDCVFEENGEIFISSPEQSPFDYLMVVMVGLTSPAWIGLICFIGSF